MKWTLVNSDRYTHVIVLQFQVLALAVASQLVARSRQNSNCHDEVLAKTQKYPQFITTPCALFWTFLSFLPKILVLYISSCIYGHGAVTAPFCIFAEPTGGSCCLYFI